jgi:two-component system invasion response regulator UvrY
MAKAVNSSSGKRRLFIVDDEPTVRRGLELFFAHTSDVEVCGSSTRAQAVQAIGAALPTVVLLEFTPYQDEGLRLIKKLRQSFPYIRIVAFSLDPHASLAEAVLQAGALGYATREDGTEELLEAVRQVSAGHTYVAPAVLKRSPRGRSGGSGPI